MPRAPWVDVAETQSSKGNTLIEQREASNRGYLGGAAHYREPRHASAANAITYTDERRDADVRRAGFDPQFRRDQAIRSADLAREAEIARAAAASATRAAAVSQAAALRAAADAAETHPYHSHGGAGGRAHGDAARARTAHLHETDYVNPRPGLSADRAAIARNRAEMDVVGRAPRLAALSGSSGIAVRGHGVQHAKKGGLVRGKRGAAVPIVAHGGELVVPQPMVAKVLRSSAWMKHVAEVSRKNGVSMKEAMKIAKGSYTRS